MVLQKSMDPKGRKKKLEKRACSVLLPKEKEWKRDRETSLTNEKWKHEVFLLKYDLRDLSINCNVWCQS